MNINEPLLKVKPCPPSGEGVHTWVFHAACCAVEAGISDDQAVKEIEALMTRNPSPPNEIEDALRSARTGRRNPSILWPQVNGEQIEAIAQDGIRVLDLWTGSPVRMQVGNSRTEEIIDCLFPGNPWLCVGQSNRAFGTQRRES